MIETEIYAYLSSNNAITALVGNRIYPLILPQNYTLPAITYTKISGQRVNAKDGQTGLANPRFQFSCWAKTYLEAKKVADVVRIAMNVFPNGTTYMQDEQDFYEPDTGLYHVPVDFIIWHNENI